MNAALTPTRSVSEKAPPRRAVTQRAAHEVSRHLPVQNPFSSRFVRPGAIPFQFPPGENAVSLVARLAGLGWRAAIIGPHGTGKSTLLASLLPELARAGCDVYSIALHDGQRRMSPQFMAKFESALATATPAACRVVVVDGYEQLSRWNRWQLRRRLKNIGVGLLVTSHKQVSLPVLFRTATDVTLAEEIVGKLIGDGTIEAGDVRAAFHRHGGNLRETLFDLYDIFEQRRD